MRPTPVERVAAAFLGLEAAIVTALAAWQIVAVVTGDTESVASAIALIVLTLVGAAALAAFAVGVWRGLSWARSGGVVVQLLVLSVAGGSLTGDTPHPEVAGLLAVPAVGGLVLLIAAARVAGRRARTEAPE